MQDFITIAQKEVCMAQQANADDETETEPTDPALAALRRLFSRDYHTVDRHDGPLGDFRLKVAEGSCFHEDRQKGLEPLGFTLGSVHQDPETETLTVYIKDTR